MVKLVMLELIGSLKNKSFHFRKRNGGTKSKKRLKTTRSTPSYVKVLFYLGKKSTVHSMQLFTRVLENQYSKSIRRFPRKVSSFCQSSALIF